MENENKPLIEVWWLKKDGSSTRPCPSLSIMVVDGNAVEAARTLLLGILRNPAWAVDTNFALSLDDGTNTIAGINFPTSYASYRKMQGKIEVHSEAGIFKGLVASLEIS